MDLKFPEVTTTSQTHTAVDPMMDPVVEMGDPEGSQICWAN